MELGTARVGGIGEKILACIGDAVPVLVKAHENGIVPQGARELLYQHCRLDAKSIKDDIIKQLH